MDPEEAEAPPPTPSHAPLVSAHNTPSNLPPLASDSDSDNDAPDVIPGTRVTTTLTTDHDGGARITVYDDEEHRIIQFLGDKACEGCFKWPKRLCTQCGCQICGGKQDEHRTIVCDTCNNYYHCDCLDPPLAEIPDGDWHCPVCKKPKGKKRQRESTKVLKKEVTVLPAKKPAKLRKSGQKVCSVVDPYHFGPIPGVEVGQTYKFRKGASEAGVHRPPMAGISGTPKVGSQSIVLSGGYKDDVDEGDSFIYSGAGGRDNTEGGGRISDVQSFDQTLDKTNAALAITMFPDLTDPEKLDKTGAESDDWTNSKEVRVIRSDKMRHSKYAPKEGFRYDGIYKLARYWPEKGKDGFITYKYQFRRDDPTPAPWTEEGIARAAELGLSMVYPDDWDPVARKTKRKREDEEAAPKKKKIAYEPPSQLQQLLELDVRHRETWEAILARSADASEFVSEVTKVFKCPFCYQGLDNPVTLQCGHSVCQTCLQKSFLESGVKCPNCWISLMEENGRDDEQLIDAWNEAPLPINEEFNDVMKYLTHTYDGSDPAY